MFCPMHLTQARQLIGGRKATVRAFNGRIWFAHRFSGAIAMARDLSEAIEILKERGLDFAQVLRDTHAETMLRLGTLLDETLEIVIKTHALKSGKSINEKAFQKRGKLEKLADKIKKAETEGLLDKVAFKDADLLREIRNEFGHLKTKLHFASPEITKLAERLSTYDPAKPNQAAILAAMTKVTNRLKAALKPT
jgi:DNA-binding MltR family transcriptional regulator